MANANCSLHPVSSHRQKRSGPESLVKTKDSDSQSDVWGERRAASLSLRRKVTIPTRSRFRMGRSATCLQKDSSWVVGVDVAPLNSDGYRAGSRCSKGSNFQASNILDAPNHYAHRVRPSCPFPEQFLSPNISLDPLIRCGAYILYTCG